MARPGSTSWWTAKVRQARAFAGASVAPDEQAALAGWLTPAQLRVFDAMHIADRRHGLDVAAHLRAGGIDDPEVLLAGLLHDAGKGQSGFIPRVLYSLSQAYGDWIWGLGIFLPPLTKSMTRLKRHAELSAMLAAGAGCSPRTVELIRRQDLPPADETARRFHLADEAS